MTNFSLYIIDSCSSVLPVRGAAPTMGTDLSWPTWTQGSVRGLQLPAGLCMREMLLVSSFSRFSKAVANSRLWGSAVFPSLPSGLQKQWGGRAVGRWWSVLGQWSGQSLLGTLSWLWATSSSSPCRRSWVKYLCSCG